MCSRGYLVLIGAAQGALFSLDIETGFQHSIFEGLDGTVNAVAVESEYVFAGDEWFVGIWNLQSGDILKLLRKEEVGGVRSMITVPETHHVWIAFSSGVIEVWNSSAKGSFEVERKITTLQGRPLTMMTGYSAVETMRFWTLASNGVNKVWTSSFSHVEKDMTDTLDALRAVSSQDAIELNKWQTTLDHLATVGDRRVVQIVSSLQAVHSNRQLRKFYLMWLMVTSSKKFKRHQVDTAQRMAIFCRSKLIHKSFSTWIQFYRRHQSIRLRSRFEALLRSSAACNLAQHFTKKLLHFTQLAKAALRRQKVVEVLDRESSTATVATYYRKWKYRHDSLDHQRRQIRLVEVLRQTATSRILRNYKLKWDRFISKKKVQQQLRGAASRVAALHGRLLLRRSYLAWSLRVAQKEQRRKLRSVAAVLIINANLRLISVYWRRLRDAKRCRQLLELRSKSSAATLELGSMKRKHAILMDLVKEKKSLDDIRWSMSQNELEMDERRSVLATLQKAAEDLRSAISQKALEDQRRVSSISEQMDHLMSVLKAKVINFYTDVALFHQIREKLRQGQDITKLFLESHQSVKRVVVEATKRPHLATTEKWPLTPEMIQKLPSHHMSVILVAIKTMIVCFDIMDKATRDSIETDVEIVVNASSLLLMADTSIAHKRKLLVPAKKK